MAKIKLTIYDLSSPVAPKRIITINKADIAATRNYLKGYLSQPSEAQTLAEQSISTVLYTKSNRIYYCE